MKLQLLFIPIFIILLSCKGNSGVVNIDGNHKIVFLDSTKAAAEINEDQINSFFKNISIIDMSIQMKENCTNKTSCLESYKEYLTQDVESFTDAEKNFLKDAFKKAYEEISKINENIIPPQIELIKTKGKHYGNSVFYTRENIIVIPKNELENLDIASKMGVIYHEIFHIISRYNPKLKSQLYDLIGFSKLDNTLVIPEQLKARLLLNPDGIEMEYIISLEDTLNNRTLNAIPIIYSAEDKFDIEKPAFFAYLKFDFYEVTKSATGNYEVICDADGKSEFSFRNAGNFKSQIQDNTGYIIHPDEIMADNFSFVFNMSEEGKLNLSPGGQKLLSDVERTMTEYK